MIAFMKRECLKSKERIMNQYLTPHVKRGAIYFGIIVAVLGIIGAIPVLNCLAIPL